MEYSTKTLIYISLIGILPICFICIVNWCCFCYDKFFSKLNFKSRTNTSPPPPKYDKVVFDKKHLPKYKDVVLTQLNTNIPTRSNPLQNFKIPQDFII